MQLSDVFLGLGEGAFGELLRGVSISRLRTYQLYERVKLRLRLAKLNTESLRKSQQRLWTRLGEHDEELAADLAQAVLISQMDLIRAVLDFLQVPHQDGFFAKDANVKSYLSEGWQQRVWDKFRETYPRAVLLFYVNHLAHEMAQDAEVFAPAA
jgi:hypothetical protein